MNNSFKWSMFCKRFGKNTDDNSPETDVLFHAWVARMKDKFNADHMYDVGSEQTLESQVDSFIKREVDNGIF